MQSGDGIYTYQLAFARAVFAKRSFDEMKTVACIFRSSQAEESRTKHPHKLFVYVLNLNYTLSTQLVNVLVT